MISFPFRIERINDWVLSVEDGGLAARSDEAFVKRRLENITTKEDDQFLIENGFAALRTDDIKYNGMLARVARRLSFSPDLAYLIVIPTLRCNLSCSYCQVSRAPIGAEGFDMDDAMVDQLVLLIEDSGVERLKIEFQGGEPTLRLDIVERIANACDAAGVTAEFVICTNLTAIDPMLVNLMNRGDFFISTSFDGTVAAHTDQRTLNVIDTNSFLDKIAYVSKEWGSDRVSALPTINYEAPPDPRGLLAGFRALGIDSIYLRPVSYHGFARKTARSYHDEVARWIGYHRRFLREVIKHNAATGEAIEEFYFSLCLRRIFSGGLNGHVDLRNPSPFGYDYLVVDYDGAIYPTDEARMLTRIGEIDLRIGSLTEGVDTDRRASLNRSALNNYDPECSQCAFQPYCGPDRIDSVARYGRIDYPTHQTFHCQFHKYIFREAFRMLYEGGPDEKRCLAQWLGFSQWEDGWVAVR